MGTRRTQPPMTWAEINQRVQSRAQSQPRPPTDYERRHPLLKDLSEAEFNRRSYYRNYFYHLFNPISPDEEIFWSPDMKYYVTRKIYADWAMSHPQAASNIVAGP